MVEHTGQTLNHEGEELKSLHHVAYLKAPMSFVLADVDSSLYLLFAYFSDCVLVLKSAVLLLFYHYYLIYFKPNRSSQNEQVLEKRSGPSSQSSDGFEFHRPPLPTSFSFSLSFHHSSILPSRFSLPPCLLQRR